MAETTDDIEAMKKRLKEIENEAEKLREMHAKLEEQQAEGTDDTDSRSIFVGNVDFSSTPEELQTHFQACGTINRVTILCDKFTGHPKGYAYIEFADSSSVANGLVLNESLFKGRILQVTPKRTNIPGFKRGRGRGRFMTRGGRTRGRGGRRPYFNPY